MQLCIANLAAPLFHLSCTQAHKLDAMEFFKKMAVSPDDLPDAIFASVGRLVWRDIGPTALGFRLLLKARGAGGGGGEGRAPPRVGSACSRVPLGDRGPPAGVIGGFTLHRHKALAVLHRAALALPCSSPLPGGGGPCHHAGWGRTPTLVNAAGAGLQLVRDADDDFWASHAGFQAESEAAGQEGPMRDGPRMRAMPAWHRLRPLLVRNTAPGKMGGAGAADSQLLDELGPAFRA